MDHISGPVVPRVSFILAHVLVAVVSLFLLVYMVFFLIRPRVKILSVHVSVFYSATRLDDFVPHVRFLLVHMLCHGYFHVSRSGSSTRRVFR